MIEIKDGSLAIEGRQLFQTLSFCVPKGSIVCITMGSEHDTTAFLDCFLGLRSLDEGYISIDGEPLLPKTKDFYRDGISFLPRNVRMPGKRASDFLDNVISLDSNSEIERPKKKLLAEWRKFGLSSSLYDATIEDVNDTTLRLMMLGMIGIMNRSIIVMDSPTLGMDDQQASQCIDYIKQLAQNGSAILIATHDDRVFGVCQNIVNIDNNSVSSLS